MWPIFFFSGGRVVSSPHRPAFDLWMARSLGDCYFRWAIELARYLFAPCKENRNPGKFCMWNPESWVCNPQYAQEIRNTTNDWNPESKFYRQILKSSTWSLVLTARFPVVKWRSRSVAKSAYYVGGARSKGFATLRNVRELLFLGQDWASKVRGSSVWIV